jgi:hypothetical protein
MKIPIPLNYDREGVLYETLNVSLKKTGGCNINKPLKKEGKSLNSR